MPIGLLIGADADAGVLHADPETARAVAEEQVDAAAVGELQGVGQQVADDLPNPGRISEHQAWQLRVNQAG